MEIDNIREEIDIVDRNIRDSFVRRMELIGQIAECKKGSHDSVYKYDRERAILEKQGGEVDETIRGDYQSIVKKVIQISRKYQYQYLYSDINDEGFNSILTALEGRDKLIIRVDTHKHLDIFDILSIISLYGVSISEIRMDGECIITLESDIQDERTRVLLYQLYEEAELRI